MSIVGSSASCERLFSIAGNIASDERNYLDPSRLERLLFLKSLDIKHWELCNWSTNVGVGSDPTSDTIINKCKTGPFIVALLREFVVVAVAEWYRNRIVACLVTNSSPVPLKTRRVGQRCTLNLSRAETSSRWCGVVVRRGGTRSGVVHVT
ncbi:uncharacterized protein TNCV_4473051 [Trichonephila clavipes]|uniref:HAT C-terminal dimerisation domain-containing protein n=1 Tax=Trichonephila clavipes TaxID=2585209 RepID=A0A8X6SLM0_TRICX|nr:uncharacterized protein TNCV_4473051 [Trichonephila clavipes]